MCTGISIKYKDNYFVGKNHDWINKQFAIVVNPIGTTTKSIVFKREDVLLDWSAKYGSITINEVEDNSILPGAMAGINDKGLCALLFWQTDVKYPEKPTKPVVSSELFAQYFLDNAATVNEAINLSKKFDIEPGTIPHHNVIKLAETLGLDQENINNLNLQVLIQDSEGNIAVIAYLDGKLVINKGKSLPIPVISNDSYDSAINYIKQFKAFGGEKDLPGEFDSFSRFTRAAFALKVMQSIESHQQAISYLFNALAYTQTPFPNSQWTVAFDLSNKTIYIRSIDNQQIRIVRLRKFDFSKEQPLKYLSINNHLSGYVESKFKKLR